MEFRTCINIPKPDFEIQPCEKLLFVGSCFADSIGERFREEGFPVTVNPYGTMYNPASIFRTIERSDVSPSTAFFTLGTNHVYRLKKTGEIVDNCQKRPAALFQEEQLTVDDCIRFLQKSIDLLRERNPQVRVVITVSPIRYRKYGFHESQISKATLLLAVNQLKIPIYYFPAYELLMDELRDYRFYAEDMLHPSRQAIEYIWECFVEACFSVAAKAYLKEWRPLKQILSHKPFDAESPAYQDLMDKTMLKVTELRKKYPTFAL